MTITDFGLARLNSAPGDQLSGEGDLVGSPRYMSPEQMRGKCDARSDIYSLGVTLWEIACGQAAWDSLDASSLAPVKSSLDLLDIRHVQADVPDDLANIIMKACAFRPEDRYQTADAFRTDLQRFVDGKRPVASPPAAISGLKRAVVYVCFLLALAAAFGLGQLIGQLAPGTLPSIRF